MPSTSKSQQRLMGMAYSLKKGEMDPKDASQEVKDLADSMTLQQLKDFASTKHEDLPENLTPANIGGMGATLLPTATQPGSGDILSGPKKKGKDKSIDDSEDLKKRKRNKIEIMKRLKTFEAFINESALTLPYGMEQFQKDEKSEGKQADIYLAHFDGRSFKAQSTDKAWDDGVPVTKYFTRGGYKSVSIPKGQHYIIEGDTFWYFKVKNTWYAVKRADYGTPPFEY